MPDPTGRSWPKRTPDPKPTVYGVRNGELVPFGADGYFIDRTPYVPVAVRAAAAAGSGGSSSSGANWLGIAEAAAGALLGAASGSADDRDGALDMPES